MNKSIILLAAAPFLLAAEPILTCSLKGDRASAVVTADRIDHNRSVTFIWETEGAAWDKRTREVTLFARNARVWDWRKYPRDGKISVTVIIDGVMADSVCDFK